MTGKPAFICWEGLPLRLVLGIMLAAHGAQKLFGAFGGSGLGPFAESLVQMGFSPGLLWAALVGCSEFFGGLFILLGWFTRLAVWPPMAVMLVAIFKVHGPHGFFLQDGGFEYPFVILGGLLTLFAIGPGPLSLDTKAGCASSPGTCGTSQSPSGRRP